MIPPRTACVVDDLRDTTPDPFVVERLVAEHLGLADRLCRRFHRGRGLDDDLQQVARLGLLLAARRYDPDIGPFDRFASVTIIGELKKHLRVAGWVVHVPRQVQEDSLTVLASADRLTNELHRPPRTSELADAVQMSEARVRTALRTTGARTAAQASYEPEMSSASADDPADLALLNTAIDALSDEERGLLGLRFDDGLSQREIAEVVDISQPQIHRRLRRALEALRAELSVGA